MTASIQPAGTATRSRARLSIGKVLGQLRDDFPEITISKIRFLESEGLVEPERTASGYRKFSADDVERLRYVLTAQRDHYLPLRVIRDNLDAIERGLEPATAASQAPTVPRTPLNAVADASGEEGDVSNGAAGQSAPSGLKLARRELEANSGLSSNGLDELLAAGLIRQQPGTEYFDRTALDIASAVARLSDYGLEARHLRAFKTAADREIGLIEQIVTPIARQRDDNARAKAAAATAELASLTARLHSALVESGLESGRPS